MFIEWNWKHQVTDGVLGKTSQKTGHTSTVSPEEQVCQVGKGASWIAHYLQRHRDNSGCSLWLLVAEAVQSRPRSLLGPEDHMLSNRHQVCKPQRPAGLYNNQPRLRPCLQAIVIPRANWILVLSSCAPTALYDDSEVLRLILYHKSLSPPVELIPLKIFQRQDFFFFFNFL